ncbi:MAG TPA: MotA/TolQ/ExbB proton channel family protein [Candidatus Polarisedimenticolaceae bacterium]|nr:MotA/TolQ/ExbB proton channel family protein [Candidatus Polarisedimenticolaceae bacterium]
MSLTELLGNVGLFGLAVMGCLAVLSVFSVTVILDKYRKFRAAQKQWQMFRPAFAKSLRAGEVKETIVAAKQHQSSYVAQVVSAGLTEFAGAKECGSDSETQEELVTSALEHSKIEALIEMRRGLSSLATIGSTAPFIGLFGTVVGIINAFRGIAATGSGGMAAVSGGIAEALVATALGIFVAIPAVVAFNHFTGDLERFQVEINQASNEIVNVLFKTHKELHATR